MDGVTDHQDLADGSVEHSEMTAAVTRLVVISELGPVQTTSTEDPRWRRSAAAAQRSAPATIRGLAPGPIRLFSTWQAVVAGRWPSFLEAR